MKPFQAQTHYEVLEISVSATQTEIRGAYNRLNLLYADDQAALYGLVDPARSEALREQLRAALQVLEDDDLRALYDEEIGLPPREQPKAPQVVLKAVLSPLPDPLPRGEREHPTAKTPPEPRQLALDVAPVIVSWGAKPFAEAPEEAEVPDVLPPELEKPPPALEQSIPTLSDDVQVAIVPARATPSREFRVEPRPRPSDIPDGVEINGDLLKQVRLAKGLSLVQLADRTRIGVKHLENVESDRYDALPAAVYLRGILMNLARELGLDGLRVSRSYLTFVEAHRSKG